MRVPFAGRVTLSGQFLVFGLAVLIAGMLTIGLWVQHEIKQIFVARTADVSALYVETVVAPHIQALAEGEVLNQTAFDRLNEHLVGSSLSKDFVSVKLWTGEGSIAYSTNAQLVGRTFPLSDSLQQAFGGDLISKISDLAGPAHQQERLVADTLIETYAPISTADNQVFAVVEFYQRPDALLAGIRSAQLRGWLIVGLGTLVMFAMLFGLARGARRLIRSQRAELEQNVTRLSGLLAQNETLRERMREAAGKVTALNEQYLHQISADLHDGPAQNIALAMLRIDDIGNGAGTDRTNRDTINLALSTALADIRSIAGGLRLPDLDTQPPGDIARRAIRDFERATGTAVDVRMGNLADDAPLPVKLTVYRVLQEALANSYKHASGASRRVTLTAADEYLTLQVTDDGPGFDPEAAPPEGSLGLAGMRDRVEVLGGRCEIRSTPGHGTWIRVQLPLRRNIDE